MRQRFLIFFGAAFLLLVLIGLNAVSYVQQDIEPDNEDAPDRSTFNTGATGTRALYDLLNETGRKVSRWQNEISELADGKNAPETFVVIGTLRREFSDREIEQLLRWVTNGGRLVVIDRDPESRLISTTANWFVLSDSSTGKWYGVDPSDPKQMTEKTPAAKPIIPSVFTKGINAVQPSRFASSLKVESMDDGAADTPDGTATSKNQPPPLAGVDTPALDAPVIYLSNGDKYFLADFPYGSGRIAFLTDPYIVANGGITLVDNAQLAINLLAADEGMIAFDEFHHGYGANQSRLVEYFSGTPVVAIFSQLVLIVGAIFISQSRRFARALPAENKSRLAKLEYVSAMAELEQRTRAYDLALENIFYDFRRRAARIFGLDTSSASRNELIEQIAIRTSRNPRDIENLFTNCEEIIQGYNANKKQVLELTRAIREVEKQLNLSRQRPARINLRSN
jgi:hypothetical protein